MADKVWKGVNGNIQGNDWSSSSFHMTQALPDWVVVRLGILTTEWHSWILLASHDELLRLKKKNVLTSESERLTLLNTVGELTDSTYQNVIFSSPPGKGAHLFLEGGGRITLNPQPSTEIVHACVL